MNSNLELINNLGALENFNLNDQASTVFSSNWSDQQPHKLPVIHAFEQGPVPVVWSSISTQDFGHERKEKNAMPILTSTTNSRDGFGENRKVREIMLLWIYFFFYRLCLVVCGFNFDSIKKSLMCQCMYNTYMGLFVLFRCWWLIESGWKKKKKEQWWRCRETKRSYSCESKERSSYW